MADTPSTFPLSRRALLAAGVVALPFPALAARGPVVTILGDSITAGLGLPARDALPAQLQAAMARLGFGGQVRGAGVSGDTTAGGAARIDFSVQPDSDIVVVALGANDLLQGVAPKVVRANLEKILTRLNARHKRIVLCGIEAPPEIGRGYAREFNAVFPALARQHGAALYPNLLAGVARNRALNQGDGIHPNAQGVLVIARRLAPVVVKAVGR